MDNNTLRQEVRNLLANGFTQTEIAAKAGIRQNTISRYINGLTHLRFNTALKLIAFVQNEKQKGRDAISTQTEPRT